MSSSHRSVRAPGAHAIRGAALPSRLIAIAVIVLALGAGAWWFFMRPGAPPIPGVTSAPTPSATPTSPDAAAPVVSDELTVDQLYREARKAMNENRMAAPAGNNALEYYLKIVARQPDDSGAKDALRELFPFATGTAEDQINQGNFDEANRVVALLAQADPSNYSLTILRSKLDAKKKQLEQAQAAAAAAAARQQTPAAPGTAPNATAATTPAATDATAPAATTTAPAPAAADSATAAATPPPAAAPRPTPVAPPPPPAPVGESRDVAVTSPPVPVYPIEAARSRKEGWVEVEFTVGPDGAVSNAHVTGSQPARLFDREAVAAVQRAKFEPKLVNGSPVAATLKRRIEFKLGNN
jgi:protein TonB